MNEQLKKALLGCRISAPKDLAAESSGGVPRDYKVSPREDGDHDCQGSHFSVLSPSS